MGEENRRTSFDNEKESGQSIADPEHHFYHLVRDDHYKEETAGEIAAPVSPIRDYNRNDIVRRSDAEADIDAGSSVLGWSSLIVSLISLFVLPVVLGAAAIVLGVISRRRGANTLGAWGIGIGAVSVIIGILVLPFF